jgi:hypothetical protein
MASLSLGVGSSRVWRWNMRKSLFSSAGALVSALAVGCGTSPDAGESGGVSGTGPMQAADAESVLSLENPGVWALSNGDALRLGTSHIEGAGSLSVRVTEGVFRSRARTSPGQTK